jgi:phosphatidylethanolamine-binding protein (PEBP) family uncharacterized protein
MRSNVNREPVRQTAQSASDIILRSPWCHIIVLNIHAPAEDKTDDAKNSFNVELGHVFEKVPKYHMKILLDFNTK